MGFGGGAVGIGIANAVLGAEICGPLLLLCWLCCWPDDAKSETSSDKGKSPKKIATRTGSRRRLGGSIIRRFGGSSSSSLHLPSTSGYSKQPLSAHRSHEEIPQRRKSQLEARVDEESHYHSAPSVIHEVVHRRDWEKSNTHLHIPLKSPSGDRKGEDEPFIQEVLHRREWPSSNHLFIPLKSPSDIKVLQDSSDSSPEQPHAEPETSPTNDVFKSEEKLTCKKHYTNIKSSKNKPKKESKNNDENEKDTDATEITIVTNKTNDTNMPSTNSTTFYIGDCKSEEPDNNCIQNTDRNLELDDQIVKFSAKDAKQSFNESIKSKEMTRSLDVAQAENVPFGLKRYRTKTFDIDLDLFVDELDRSGAVHPSLESRSSFKDMTGMCTPAPSVESDLDFDLEGCNERPPSYEEVTDSTPTNAKETAI